MPCWSRTSIYLSSTLHRFLHDCFVDGLKLIRLCHFSAAAYIFQCSTRHDTARLIVPPCRTISLTLDVSYSFLRSLSSLRIDRLFCKKNRGSSRTTLRICSYFVVVNSKLTHFPDRSQGN